MWFAWYTEPLRFWADPGYTGATCTAASRSTSLETVLAVLLVCTLSVAAIVQLAAAPKSWGTWDFYRQTWAFVKRDPNRDKSLDKRLAVSNGVGLAALALIAIYIAVYG